MLATAMGGDEGTYVEAQLLIMERNGYPEETYYTFSYSPIPDDDGTAGGIICANTDDTQRVIGERQMALLRDLAAGDRHARNWRGGVRAQRPRAADERARPAVRDDLHGGTPRRGSEACLRFRNSSRPPRNAGDDRCRGCIALATRRSVASQTLRTVSDLAPDFRAALPTGPWAEPPRQVALGPILPAGETGRARVLVVGLNPHRASRSPWSPPAVASLSSPAPSRRPRRRQSSMGRSGREALSSLMSSSTTFRMSRTPVPFGTSMGNHVRSRRQCQHIVFVRSITPWNCTVSSSMFDAPPVFQPYSFLSAAQ